MVQPVKLGEVRPTQVLFSYGVGAIIDLPHLSAIILGLSEWQETMAEEVAEPRLLAAVRRAAGNSVRSLRLPPRPPDEAGGEDMLVGIPATPFPRWLICPNCRVMGTAEQGLFKLSSNPWDPRKNFFFHESCAKTTGGRKPSPAIPARFLIACEDGHIDDFPWAYYVHDGATDCDARLRFDEIGTSGEAADIFVKCLTCDRSKNMAHAFSEDARAHLPRCRGFHPHLRQFQTGGCDRPASAMLLGASNSWFPIPISALTIPARNGALSEAVKKHWQYLKNVDSVDIIKVLRTALAEQLRSLKQLSDEDLFEEIQRQRFESEGDGDPVDIKIPEWDMFTNPDPTRMDSDFRLRESQVPTAFKDQIEKIVLVERLREVRALIGFTRVDTPEETGDQTTQEVRRAPLTRGTLDWVPASVVRGEGIFIQFKESSIQAWLKGKKAALKNRDDALRLAHRRWRQARRIEPFDDGYPGLRLTLIHTLSHALMRELALECGYSTASIRERIYSRDPGDGQEPFAGILLYTATPDSEGTLGGLVAQGEPERLGSLLEACLDRLKLCSSDPFCSEHLGGATSSAIHGAACHACAFAAETSCEHGNRYLDRSLLVETVTSDGAEFFNR